MRAHRVGWIGASVLACAVPASAWEPPKRLSDTGLYSDWDRRTVDPAHLRFTPQYPLWTDGAVKARFIHIPEGTFIDASDCDSWVFPVGTRLWKEFRIGARRVETRYIEHAADGWQYAVYLWKDDETDAPLAPERGAFASAVVAPGVPHRVPSRADCRICHEGRPVPVLGFTALQLSRDRDPHALHAERPGRDDVSLDALVKRRLVRGLAPALQRRPPRILARSKVERAALGYLYGNCAICHNARSSLADLGFSLDAPSALRSGDEDALLTAVGRASHFRLPGASGGSERVRAGDPDASVIAVRMESRNPALQMPPLGTQLVDGLAVRLVRQWIAEELEGPKLTRNERKDKEGKR
jgi:hypothetical protein